MNLANSARSIVPSAYIQPMHFADYLSSQQRYGLFLDIDGTLAEFTLDPKDSFIPTTTLTLLQDIQNCGVPIAVVTGRSLTEARQMLSPLQMPIAATHGLEISFNSTVANNENFTIDTTELTAIKKSVSQSCLSLNELTIEDKPHSIALHYRQNPSLEDIAYSIMAKALKKYPDWQLKQGKYVWELVPKGADKGTAILTLLENMPASATICPIFIGDDITDEAGFIAVQTGHNITNKPLKGMGIKVGNELSRANLYVNDIQEVTLLLKSFLSFCQKQNRLFNDMKHADCVNTSTDLNKNTRSVI